MTPYLTSQDFSNQKDDKMNIPHSVSLQSKLKIIVVALIILLAAAATHVFGQHKSDESSKQASAAANRVQQVVIIGKPMTEDEKLAYDLFPDSVAQVEVVGPHSVHTAKHL
jgi:hypothetical protein